MVATQKSHIKLPHRRWLFIAIGVAICIISVTISAHFKPLAGHSSVKHSLNNGAFTPRDCNSAATCIAAPDAFLKINEFYVLFTYPIVPHLDKSGTFIVGLDALAEMIGATVRTDAPIHSETIMRIGHSVTFTEDVHTASVDGKPVPIPVPALMDKPSHKMIVPLSMILQAFHIRTHWNAHSRILAIQDKTFFPVFTTDPDILGPIGMQEGSNYMFPERGYLVPISMKWYPVPGQPYNRDFELKVRNVSVKTIGRDHCFINFVQADFGVAGYQNLQNGAGGTLHGWNDPRIHQPPLKQAAFRTAVHQGVGVSGSEYSLYVLAWLLVTDK